MTQNTFYNTYSRQINHFIAQALEEDIGTGDQSSLSCLDNRVESTAVLRAKEEGIIAGIALAEKIFHHVNPAIDFKANRNDGDSIIEGDTVFTIKGPQHDVLATERLVLNCMQRMSGIATLTKRICEQIKHTQCRVLDTRKTTPNFRYPEKWAVKIGGGKNHRMGLYDVIMIKDNHIDFNGSLQATLKRTEQYLKKNNLNIKTIVEVRNMEEINACMDFPWLHRLLLDNMRPSELAKAVAHIGNRFPTEASGNITEDNIVAVAESGVNYASLGALTHSAKTIDLSLKSI